jgi:hypothetical protein
MFLKCFALSIQAILPTTIITCIWHLTTLPSSEWGWLEYLMAAPLVGFTAIIVVLMAWRIASLLLYDTSH